MPTRESSSVWYGPAAPVPERATDTATPIPDTEQAETIRRFLTEQCQKVTVLATQRIYTKKESEKKSAKRLKLEEVFAGSYLSENSRLANALRNVAAAIIEEPIALPLEETEQVPLPFFCAFVPVRASNYGHTYPLRKVAVAYRAESGHPGYPVAVRYDSSLGNIMDMAADAFRLATTGEIVEFFRPFSLDTLKSLQRIFNSEIRSPENPAYVYGVL